VHIFTSTRPQLRRGTSESAVWQLGRTSASCSGDRSEENVQDEPNPLGIAPPNGTNASPSSDCAVSDGGGCAAETSFAPTNCNRIFFLSAGGTGEQHVRLAASRKGFRRMGERAMDLVPLRSDCNEAEGPECDGVPAGAGDCDANGAANVRDGESQSRCKTTKHQTRGSVLSGLKRRKSSNHAQTMSHIEHRSHPIITLNMLLSAWRAI
jgi:hypothetical protein